MSRVTRWVEQNAHPLAGAGPEDPLDDVAPPYKMIGAATVVALGAATRDAHELSVVAHRRVRHLVEHQGFRSLVLEGDDAASTAIDEYVRTGSTAPPRTPSPLPQRISPR
ncbi:hypothetical protein [Nocardia spumae]|uniref:hypothetical protein n=1 Tax=Nocardia spumae TaxID=2887190 RepID=UPI001D156875|nr:hypothetical protein [Nocardia spumae]